MAKDTMLLFTAVSTNDVTGMARVSDVVLCHNQKLSKVHFFATVS